MTTNRPVVLILNRRVSIRPTSQERKMKADEQKKTSLQGSSNNLKAKRYSG